MAIRDISAAALKEADDSVRRGGFKLNVPEHAKTNAKNPKQKFWTESGTILSCKRYEKPGKSGLIHDVFEIKLTITAEGSGENIGKTFTVFPRIAFDAPNDPQHGDRIMSNRSTALLRQFIEANGIELPTDEEGRPKVSADLLLTLFTPEGGDSPVIGNRVSFEVKQTEPDNPEDPNAKWNPDVQTFMVP